MTGNGFRPDSIFFVVDGRLGKSIRVGFVDGSGQTVPGNRSPSRRREFETRFTRRRLRRLSYAGKTEFLPDGGWNENSVSLPPNTNPGFRQSRFGLGRAGASSVEPMMIPDTDARRRAPTPYTVVRYEATARTGGASRKHPRHPPSGWCSMIGDGY